MKKIIGVALAAACTCPSQAAGEQNKLDTTRVNNLNEVVVKAVRAPKSSPFAVENINKPELERFATSGRELPCSSPAHRACLHGARTAWVLVLFICVCVVLPVAALT